MLVKLTVLLFYQLIRNDKQIHHTKLYSPFLFDNSVIPYLIGNDSLFYEFQANRFIYSLYARVYIQFEQYG